MRLLAAASIALASVASAQDATIVYQLGNDTVAVETFTRTANRLVGETVTRSGAAIQRLQYDFTLSRGRITSGTVKRRQADGSTFATGAQEIRLTFRADSAFRESVLADNTQRVAFAASNASVQPPVYMYAVLEVIHAMGRGRDSMPAIGTGGNNIGHVGLEQLGGDTLRLRGGPYAMRVRFDRESRLQVVDGSYTTNKMMGTRTAGRADIQAIAMAMKPTGTLSPRMTAYAAFQQGPITVNYGSPAVRGRTVWGGQLVPYDSVWRTGANEATHLATSKRIQMGDMTLEPGLYTLWVQHTRAGTWLIVNRQVGQWGTQYNASNDVGRVAMQMADAPSHVEDMTVTLRSMPQGRGAIDIAWGDKVATAAFSLRP